MLIELVRWSSTAWKGGDSE